MYLTGSQIREKFVSYFQDKRGHLYLPSASLIPDNPTLLLTSAGMVPFVPIFLGQAQPTNPPRAVTVQKCARAGGKDSDIENVGRTARHHSFFEMQGNFSFGDYFKHEVIPWAWEFVTKELGLEKEKLSVTIFKGDEQNPADEEAFEIWHKVVGLPAERIIRLSRKDNFWGPPGPTGPCGPCSEIYYDRGPEYGCNPSPEKCGIGKCECDRYLEFWNLVFMQLFKDEAGNFKPLASKNVDTGSGLERVALIVQKKNNSYETDLFFPILQKISDLAKVPYKGGVPKPGDEKTESGKKDTYLKIITDHARCVSFLIADGIRPSNVGRGYVLRFIIRRAARFGRLLGLVDPFIYKLVPIVVELYGKVYPELANNQKLIEQVLKEEEERFSKTIDRGMALLNELLTNSNKKIDGNSAFNLYATYGFPIELTKEIAIEHGKDIDMEGFREARKQHEEVSSGNKFNVIIADKEAFGHILKESGVTKFTGYDQIESPGQIIAVIHDGKLVGELEEGQIAEVVLDQTPFYAESGGQVGDTGIITSAESSLAVLDTQKHEGLHIHKVKALSGQIRPDIQVKAMVDAERRKATVLHHSTAHLFHAAVRELLGKQVVQAGSRVGPESMRFDFTFERQLNEKELAAVESLINEWVRLGLPVTTVEMPIEEAKRTGAIAMFGEKYGDIVRVVRMGDYSIEFCGGTHISSTSEIGLVKIISEGSIASGVRRVEALAGPSAWQFISKHLNILSQAAAKLKVNPSDLSIQIDKLQDQVKQKEKLAQNLNDKLALSFIPDLLSKVEKIANVRLITAQVPNLSADSLKTLADTLRQKGEDIVVVLGTVLEDNKVSLVAGVSDPLVKQGFNAGNLVKVAATVCGGGGGGKPQLAQAGGKDTSKIDAALNTVKDLIGQGQSART